MKRLMILGSVKYFENLVASAKELGIYTIVCDNRENTPAKKICDEAINVDIMNLELIKKIAIEKKVDGILTSFTDTLLLPHTHLVNELNLPKIIKLDQLESVTNKLVMKEIFKKNKIKSTDYWVVDTIDEAQKLKIKFPIVMKPLDSCGSKGIFFIYNNEELVKNFKETQKLSSDGRVLIEEFYESDEIQGLCWVHNGEAHVLYVGDRELVNIHQGRPGKPRKLIYPSKYCYQYEQEIREIYQKIATAFNIKNGPIYVQMFVGNDGLKVSEMMTRLPGGCDYLAIKEATGFDIGKMFVKFCIGEDIDFQEVKKVEMSLDKSVFALPIYLKPGKVEQIIGIEEIKKLEYVFDIFFELKSGDVIEDTGDMKQDVGRIFGVANNIFQAKKYEEEIHKLIDIRNGNGERMINNF